MYKNRLKNKQWFLSKASDENQCVYKRHQVIWEMLHKMYLDTGKNKYLVLYRTIKDWAVKDGMFHTFPFMVAKDSILKYIEGDK